MVPLILQMDFVLNVWLKEVPEYAGIFCKLSLINAWVIFSCYPIWHGILSTGKNRKFRTIDSFVVMLTFPLTYICLHFSPIGYICSHIFVNAFRVIYATLSLRKLTYFSIRAFVSQSLSKCFMVGVISIPLPIYITINISGWRGFFVCLSVFLVMFTASTLCVGLNKDEREKVMMFARSKFNFLF